MPAGMIEGRERARDLMQRDRVHASFYEQCWTDLDQLLLSFVWIQAA